VQDGRGATVGEMVPDTQYRSFQLAQDQIRLQQVQLEKQTTKKICILYDLTQNR